MSYEVVILKSAEQDLKDLRLYLINHFGKTVWQDSYNKIKSAINNLIAFPYAGSIPSELESLEMAQYRQIITGINRIIYEVRGQRVYIHLIADSRRDMKSLLIKRILRTGDLL